jgi:ASC-1-like (ASCH) protein
MPKYKVGDEVMFTKSMAPVRVIELLEKHKVYGQLYTVAKINGGKEMVATEEGLAPLSDFPQGDA